MAAESDFEVLAAEQTAALLTGGLICIECCIIDNVDVFVIVACGTPWFVNPVSPLPVSKGHFLPSDFAETNRKYRVNILL